LGTAGVETDIRYAELRLERGTPVCWPGRSNHQAIKHEDTFMKRMIEIETPFGPEALLFHRMRAKEELSRLSEYELDLLSPDGALKLDDVLGKPVTVNLELPEEKIRHFNGYVTRIAQVGMHGRHHAYRATVRPWLWFLTRTTNCRIFQEKTVPDVLNEVFARHSGVADVKFELTESYAPWLYCVQYRETDFNFVSRLMEDEGIYYYFKHSEGRHTLVIADSVVAHSTANGGEIPFIEPEKLVRAEREHVSEWSVSHELQPGKYALTDYDFEKPAVDLQVRTTFKRDHPLAEYEIYEYPGDYLERGDGELYAQTRIEEVQARFERVQGVTNARPLATGNLFTLTDHPRDDQNTEYLVVSAEYELKSNEYEAMDQEGAVYHCKFSALNTRQPFRPERATPKPIVQGPQTAIVVGPSGEEIHTDKFGRVKVHFHWDRYGNRDDKSSCWIRVSQNWGGKGWGGMFIPHVGQEVIVHFLEGDPDNPLVTGRVYNAENMPPVALPGGKTQSIIRDHGGNEIIMEGAAGGQKMRLYSPTHETSLTMGNSIDWKTVSDYLSTVGGKTDLKHGGTVTFEFGNDWHVKVESNVDSWYGGNASFKYDGTKIDVHGGLVSDTFVGGKHSIFLGLAWNKFISNTLEYSVGWKTTRAMSWEYKRTGGRSIIRGGAKQDTVTQDTITIDSNVKTSVIGGGGDANYCKVILDGKVAQVKCGSAHATFKKDDKVTINSATNVIVVGKDTVVVDGKNGVIINSDHFKARKGKFTTKNIQDLA
jgi:type VI secretion system secreted protein VgrG